MDTCKCAQCGHEWESVDPIRVIIHGKGHRLCTFKCRGRLVARLLRKPNVTNTSHGGQQQASNSPLTVPDHIELA